MGIILRPYQESLIGDARAAFERHRRVLIVAPTGAGKTAMFCDVTQKSFVKGKRVYLVAHRIEIVEQIGAALTRVDVAHGWIAPGHLYREQSVMVCMVQSLSRRIDKLPAPDLLVIDEAHHATAATYRKLQEAWPDAYVLGVSASPARTDGSGLGGCFDALVNGPTMRELITRGYLADYRIYAPPIVANLDQVATRAGDYALDQAAAAMDLDGVTGDAVSHYRKYLDGQPAIAFCSSVAHAEHVAAQFATAGYRAASVDGSMPLAERRERIASIGDGRLQVLTSCDVISEGTDIPAVSGAILLRPTKSLIVYLQQVGRVLRPKPDGSPAIVLDHVGNVQRMGMPCHPREWRLDGIPKRSRPPPVVQCGKCYAAFAPAPKCPACGHVFWQKKKPALKSFGAIDAELVEMDAAALKIIEAKKAAERAKPLADALAKCRSLQDVHTLAKARGYQSGWAYRQWLILSARRRRDRQQENLERVAL